VTQKPSSWASWLLIAGGLLLVFGKQIPDIDLPDINWGQIIPIVRVSLEDKTLLLVHEKTNAPVSETMLVRTAPQFVLDNKMARHLDVDEDDEWVTPVKLDAEKSGVTPPFAAIVRMDGSSITEISKIKKWPASLEELK
jgi:hypothetical protein